MTLPSGATGPVASGQLATGQLATGQLADGEWHRLHPATPLLRGGFAFIAIAGVILVNLRDVWVQVFLDGFFGVDTGVPGPGLDDLIASRWFALILTGIAVLLLGVIGAFWLSWRMHTFRITEELVEVRSGVLYRTHRRGRLDRIQGVNVVRPLFPRLFGAAKLDVALAGQDGNIPLAYLKSAQADALRAEILHLAVGMRANPNGQTLPPGLIEETAVEPGISAGADPASSTTRAQRLGAITQARTMEFLAPELDPQLAATSSVVRVHTGRLIGSLLMGPVLWAVATITGLSIAVALGADPFILIALIPGMIPFIAFLAHRISRSLRYSIAATPEGIRIGFGLLSVANETIPMGRIHAIHISQPITWRPFGWFTVSISRATTRATDASGQRSSTSLLPVGDLEDVRRVVGLVLPELANDSSALAINVTGTGEAGGFTISPPRARLVRWFSRKRNGLAIAGDTVLARRGAIWRTLSAVPLARIQSVELARGPLAAAQRLAVLQMHVVGASAGVTIGALDESDAAAWFSHIAARNHAAIAAELPVQAQESVQTQEQEQEHAQDSAQAPTQLRDIPEPGAITP